jgi:hypothetical protein
VANISAYAEKAALDWLFLGATPVRPATLFLGLSLGTPTSVSASEIALTNYSRAVVSFSAAASPGGSVLNNAAISFKSMSPSSTMRGWQLWDAAAAGNMLWYGTLSAATANNTASAFTIAAGSGNMTIA